MKAFLLSLRSEFYKTRKTLAFWCAILLPLLICLLMTIGFLTNAEKMASWPGELLWLRYVGSVLNIMGVLLLPIFVIFTAYSVNNIEHKADTWKMLFSLPLPKFAVYAAKYVYALLLILISLALFVIFTLGFANLLSALKPELRFNEYHMEYALLQVYFKLFLSSLGILSIQFLFSLLWKDFLKPMGIGFVGTISGVIMASAGWKYAYLFPYSHPMLALTNMMPRTKTPAQSRQLVINILTDDVYVSLAIAVVVFFAGYFILQKRSIK
ncbi:ABC transporter permease [Mucilaginibacter sp. UR6-1]|uniref:ABC transporter permease n=1 Tax=Mucilaginibacter sp. UR6-1 TaxID=1435643 RepID=UPI001E459DF4|nr:ABC transporter permease [Mucilaginibacter sp. UR6-1]MCC8408389.1 ABC transporter permease [Mucilaginibacter sp. UR6-1]